MSDFLLLFLKGCFWWWSGGEAAFLHLGKSSGNIIGQFPQCTNFLPQEMDFLVPYFVERIAWNLPSFQYHI